ncbi:MAG TPA: EamA family transporter [Methylomirabilota bacterium]|nr:EamA family transporter [Methylomirabilota bacterium]
MPPLPQVLALSSAVCTASATLLIQRGLARSNFYAGAWINVVVGAVAAWTATLLLVPWHAYTWRSVPYFVFSGVVGTAGGRLFRVLAIQKVGAPVAAAINNLAPLVATGLAILLLGEHVTLPILGGTLVIVLGTILLSLSGRYVGFRVRDLAYPFIAASCFGTVAIVRKIGLSPAGPLFDAAVNVTAALIASSTFVIASGNLGSLHVDRRSVGWFVGGGIAENSGVFLVLLALGGGDVSVVIPLAGTAPLFVLLITYFLPGQAARLNWRLVLGSVLIVLGVMVLTR